MSLHDFERLLLAWVLEAHQVKPPDLQLALVDSPKAIGHSGLLWWAVANMEASEWSEPDSLWARKEEAEDRAGVLNRMAAYPSWHAMPAVLAVWMRNEWHPLELGERQSTCVDSQSSAADSSAADLPAKPAGTPPAMDTGKGRAEGRESPAETAARLMAAAREHADRAHREAQEVAALAEEAADVMAGHTGAIRVVKLDTWDVHSRALRLGSELESLRIKCELGVAHADRAGKDGAA